MFDLTGKCALVTGASGGIGEAVAEALHGQGATVALSGTRRQKLEEVAARLGSRVHVLPCDLRDRAQVSALVRSPSTRSRPRIHRCTSGSMRALSRTGSKSWTNLAGSGPITASSDSIECSTLETRPKASAAAQKPTTSRSSAFA